MNLLEISRGIVHADGHSGDDHTLCGVTAANILDDITAYEPDKEDIVMSPCMMYTNRKIDCPECAAIIRHCCRLGLRSLKRQRTEL